MHLAKHLTLDYYECDPNILRDSDFLEKTLNKAANAIGATILSSHFHEFEPQWVTGVVILSESHFTIHTWPEYGYAAIDIFACWDVDFNTGINMLNEAFNAKHMNILTDLERWAVNSPWLSSVIKPKIDWEKQYQESGAWGIASSIDVFDCKPELIRDAGAIKEYVQELCQKIKMKTYWDTQVIHFGEDERVEWYSMTQLIETSLISGHFANATNAAYIDVFSCKYYNPQDVADFTTRFFKWKYFNLNINLRDEK